MGTVGVHHQRTFNEGKFGVNNDIVLHYPNWSPIYSSFPSHTRTLNIIH